MSEEQPVPVKRRKRQRAQRQAIWPMEAVVQVPGQRTPVVYRGTRCTREPGLFIFDVPDTERPYMTRRIFLHASPGLVVQLTELAMPQAQPQPVYHEVQQASQRPGESVGGPGATLRMEQTHPWDTRPLRSRSGPGVVPASEAFDEAGNPVVVPAAFGLAVG
jgi:hypothetical protein